MSELERIMRFRPAWDKRDPDPAKDYGVHGVELLMVVKGPEGAVQFLLYTGWMLPETIGVPDEEKISGVLTRYREASRSFANGNLLAPLPADLGYHSSRPMYEGHEPIESECEFVDGPCYYDGSSLRAWVPFELLLRQGDEGVWRYLEKYYESVFQDGEE